MWASSSLAAEPVRILFFGNSFTYTCPPALQYSSENVNDLNAQNAIDLPIGSDTALPQPWGGVPVIFKALTDQVGLEFLAALGPELDSRFAPRDLRKRPSADGDAPAEQRAGLDNHASLQRTALKWRSLV